MALDKNGGTVICVTSMNNLFGTGRIAAGTGVLLAASPHSNPTPDLAASIAYTPAPSPSAPQPPAPARKPPPKPTKSP